MSGITLPRQGVNGDVWFSIEVGLSGTQPTTDIAVLEQSDVKHHGATQISDNTRPIVVSGQPHQIVRLPRKGGR